MLVINPGTLSKRKAPGSYARISLYAHTPTSQGEVAGAGAGAGAGASAASAAEGAEGAEGTVAAEGTEGAAADDNANDNDDMIAHRVFERARVDVIRI